MKRTIAINIIISDFVDYKLDLWLSRVLFLVRGVGVESSFKFELW
jgi:hypothetical protein